MTVVRGLYAAAAALAVAGLGLRLAPTSLPGAAAALLAVATTVTPDTALTSARPVPKYDAIVGANVFSPERTPPAVRFAPPGRAVQPRPRGPVFRLYGITAGPQGAVAIINAGPKSPGAQIYRVGDVVAGARLVAITDSTVTLAEPSGPLVLRLQPPPRRKP